MALHIALTGGIASGKTAVTNLFSSFGIVIIDADLVAREVVKPDSIGLQKIVDIFGKTILQHDGTLNRSALRSIVFNDESARLTLNEILHPMIRQEMKRQRKQTHSIYTISAIPLLYESGQYKEYDRVLVIDCLEKTQIKRLVQRDNIDLAQAKAILASQASREQRLSIADDIITNNSDLHSLEQQVIKLHKLYEQLSKQ